MRRPRPNNVVASLSPSGEIDAAIGGSKQSVSVTFTTDDGNAATASERDHQPWPPCRRVGAARRRACRAPSSAPAAAASCRWIFRRRRPSSGTLTLNYTYVDGLRRGAQRGAQYSLRHDHQWHRGRQRVSHRPGQCSDDGAARSLWPSPSPPMMATLPPALSVLTDLTTLPPGWSSPAKTLAATASAPATAVSCS